MSALAQRRVIEQPVLEVASEAVHQHDFIPVAAVNQVSDAATSDLDELRLMGLGPFARFRRHVFGLEFRDGRVDVCVRNRRVRDDAEQRTDGQRIAFARDLAAQEAAHRGFDTVGDPCRPSSKSRIVRTRRSRDGASHSRNVIFALGDGRSPIRTRMAVRTVAIYGYPAGRPVHE